MKEIILKCEGKEYYDLEELIQFQGKLKAITEEKFKDLKESIKKDGIVLSFHVFKENNKIYILDGHHRHLALKALKEEGFLIPKIPCNPVIAKNKKEAAKIILISNSRYAKISEESLSDYMIEFDLKVDELEYLDIPELNMKDILMSGYEDVQGLTDADEVPEIDKNIHNVQLGQIWKLGDHRLMCDDSTDKETIERLMNGERADMIFTDPPYNLDYKGKTKQALTIKNDSMDDEIFFEFLYNSYLAMISAVKPGGAIYVAHADSEGANFRSALKKSGFLLKQTIIWVKNTIVMGRQDYHWKHEPILYGWAPGASHSWYSDRKQSTVFECKKPSKNDIHPTMKPVELVEYFVGNSSKQNDIVLDSFGGSGSTLIACEKTNRKCFMMELDPHYCSVIIERWQQFTGKEAELISE